MPVGLSRKTVLILKTETARNILHLSQPVKIVLVDKRCQLRRPIPLTTRSISVRPPQNRQDSN
jgi:hypothetical protein